MVLIAVGAIMRFAVSAKAGGFNIHTTGMVLMVVWVIGAVLSIAFWASWGGFGRRSASVGTQRTVVDSDRTVVREREVL
jgi:hypothetical protein